ncbi:MAG TPA: TonB-dependent receptor, partial [Caulobacteraceae bacterium]
MKLRSMMLAATALAGGCWAGQALAAEPPAGQSGALQEVVVTAQKRAEDVQKIPLAVTPVLGAKLVDQGVTDVRELGDLVPAVVLGQDYIYTQVDIRGVGANNDAPALDPAVAFNIDGVYQARDYGAYGSFYDIDRVEVLRGPQGTLYGRNATGGSINVITNKPVDAFHAAAEEEFGDYGLIRSFGMLNVPLSDTLAIRAAFQQDKHDGYLTSGFNDENSIAGRLQALYRPNSNFSLLLAGEMFHDSSNGAHTVEGLPYLHPDNPWYDPLTVQQAQAEGGAESHFTDWAVHAQMDWNLGGVTLTDIPAYKHVHANGTDPVVGVFSTSDTIDKSYSDELRLTSNEARPLSWVIGGYFFREDDYSYGDYFEHTPFFGFDSITTNPDIKEVSWAAFGQATYAIQPDLRVTGGLRYSIDTKSATGQDVSYLQFPPGPEFESGVTPDNFPSTTWHHLDWRVGVDYDLTPQSMVYANISTGYLEGGFNIGSAVGLLPNFQPEKLTAYTVGAKNRFFDNRLQVNWEAFYYNYKDYIVSVYLTQGPAVGQFALFNTPATIYGGELETVWRAAANDVFTANLALLHGRYGNFVQTFISTGLTNLSGKTLEKSPPLSIQAGYEHTFPLARGDAVKFGVQTSYSSSYWTLFDHTPGAKQPSFTRTNVVLTYQAPGDR